MQDSMLHSEVMAAIVSFLVMVLIQDGWQYIQYKDWPKQEVFQVYVLNRSDFIDFGKIIFY